jgi:hypothetical protein
VSGLWVPGGQGVGSPERAGQKQPEAQGAGGEEDAGAQKKPGGQGSQLPVPLMKKPDRQPVGSGLCNCFADVRELSARRRPTRR